MVVDCDSDATYSVKRTLEDTGLFEVDSFNHSAQALSSFVIFHWLSVLTTFENRRFTI
jgi:hypothetical protein